MEVPGKETNLGQSPGCPDRRGACGLGCPGQRRFGGQMVFAAIFDEGDELTEQSFGLVQLSTKGALHGQLVGKGLPKGAHCTSPGQGRAIMRKLSRSSLA